jgi:XTP/dITP diphosphohydrolase
MVTSQSPSTLLLLVGSTNPHKVEEIDSILGGIVLSDGRSVQVISSSQLPPGPKVDEPGSSFGENARIKAMEYSRRAATLPSTSRPEWVLADDSGLSVDALGGAPGVWSARFAGPDATDEANNKKLLRELAGVPQKKRGARFICALSLVGVPGTQSGTPEEILRAEGACRGEILLEERGTGGFGYDPLFFVPPLGRSYAEISQEEKNAISHRGEALRRLRSCLESLVLRKA